MSGILSKHLGDPEPLKIGEDVFYLQPLGTESLPYFFKAMKAFSGASGEDASTEDMLKNIDDEGLNAIRKIIDDTMDKSFPNETEEERRKFGMKYMMNLFPKIMELNLSQAETTEDKKKSAIIKRLQEKKNAESEKQDTPEKS